MSGPSCYCRHGSHEAITRLGKKLYLLEHRTKTHDLAMCWSMAGIILMMLDAEFNKEKNCVESIVLRSGVSITTIISIVFIVRYNFDERKIFKIDNSLQSWHTVLLGKSTIYFLFEIFFLFLHPVPIEILNFFSSLPSRPFRSTIQFKSISQCCLIHKLYYKLL